MVCYAIPLSASIILKALRVNGKVNTDRIAGLDVLNKMLFGGSLMLVIDHVWNNELFLITENFYSDILLGFAMTLGLVGFWKFQIYLTSRNLVNNSQKTVGI